MKKIKFDTEIQAKTKNSVQKFITNKLKRTLNEKGLESVNKEIRMRDEKNQK